MVLMSGRDQKENDADPSECTLTGKMPTSWLKQPNVLNMFERRRFPGMVAKVVAEQNTKEQGGATVVGRIGERFLPIIL